MLLCTTIKDFTTAKINLLVIKRLTPSFAKFLSTKPHIKVMIVWLRSTLKNENQQMLNLAFFISYCRRNENLISLGANIYMLNIEFSRKCWQQTDRKSRFFICRYRVHF